MKAVVFQEQQSEDSKYRNIEKKKFYQNRLLIKQELKKQENEDTCVAIVSVCKSAVNSSLLTYTGP